MTPMHLVILFTLLVLAALVVIGAVWVVRMIIRGMRTTPSGRGQSSSGSR